MRYVAAYLLAVLGGKEGPSTADIEKILSSVGIEADATRLSKVVADLKGKSVEELIKEGREKLSSMPVGGGAVAAAAPDAVAAPAAAAEKKEDKKGKECHRMRVRLQELQHGCFNLNDDQNITIFRMNLC